MIDQYAILIADVVSVFRKGKDHKIYGKRHDKVKIISSDGNVWIVEGKDKNRFPAHENKLQTI